MTDVFTKAKRSDVMSRIRSRGNKATELALMHVFRSQGFTGWRRQMVIRVNAQRSTSNVERSRLSVGRWTFPRRFAVRPDFVFSKRRLAVFVDGCFWHGCPQHATKPRNNAVFWRKKFAANKVRDRLVTRTLRQNGWRVLRIWEHTLRWATNDAKREARLVARLRRALSPSPVRRPAPALRSPRKRRGRACS